LATFSPKCDQSEVKDTYPDGSFEQYQYDPRFHHVTQTTNALGETTTNVYDETTTGDLLSTTDALGDKTTYTYYLTAGISNGLVASIKDARGNSTDYVYDSARRLVESFDALGVPTWTGYDTNGNVAWTEDFYYRTTYSTYDNNNRLLASEDADGRTRSQTYDAAGLVTAATDARGFKSTTTYDQRGLVTSATDNLGVTVVSNVYDAAGNLRQSSDARNNPTSYGYDVDNRPYLVTRADGSWVETFYDQAGQAIGTLDNEQRSTSTVYDLRGRVIQTTDAMGRTTETAYDQVGNVIATTDSAGQTTQTEYDLLNRVTAVIDPLLKATQTFYDKVGNVIETIDAAGKAFFAFFDAANREVATLDADGYTTATDYNAVGDVTRTVDERGKSSFFDYDNADEETAAVDANGNRTKTIRDADGNVVETIDANGKATFAWFDGDGREVQAENADGLFSSETFDTAGNVTSTTDENLATTYTWYDSLNRAYLSFDPNRHLTQTVYDLAGRVAAVFDGLGHETQYGYNPDDQQTAVEDGNGHLTQEQYDSAGRLIGVLDADGNRTTYAYDDDGNQVVTITTVGAVAHASVTVYDQDNRVAATIDRLGRKKVFGYDNDGRLLVETWYNADNSLADVRRYGYDQAGNLTSASNALGTRSYAYTYDDVGRTKTQTDPFGKTLTYGYDGVGRVKSVADSFGGQLASVYDGDGRLQSRQLSGTVQAQVRVDFTYMPRGQVYTESRYTDVAGQSKIGQTVFTYDAGGNVQRIQHQNAAGTSNLLDFLSTYDATDRLASETDNGTALNYGYDNADQLTAARTKGYGYDSNGNATAAGTTTFVVGPDNLLVSDGTWTYSYDAENNRVKKSKGANAETWTYGYDLNNQMVWAEQRATDNPSAPLEQRVVFQYDVFGQLVEEDASVYNSNGVPTTTTTRFAWDRGQIWATLDGTSNSNLTARYVWGDNTDELLARVVTSGPNQGLAYYLTDRLGSVRGLTDSTGAVQDQINYDAYGNVTGESNQGFGDRFRYAGYLYEATVSLYGIRARWFDPTTQRWTTEDPEGFAAGSNFTDYVSNNPTGATDPTGLEGDYTDDSARVRLLLSTANIPRCAACHCTGVLDGRPISSLSSSEQIAIMRWTRTTSPEAAATSIMQLRGNTEKVLSRVDGGLRILAGLVGGSAALLLSRAGITPGAAAFAGWSADQIGTGLAEIWTGQYKTSLGASAIKQVAGDGLGGKSGGLAYDVIPAILAGGVNVSGGGAPQAAGRLSLPVIEQPAVGVSRLPLPVIEQPAVGQSRFPLPLIDPPVEAPIPGPRGLAGRAVLPGEVPLGSPMVEGHHNAFVAIVDENGAIRDVRQLTSMGQTEFESLWPKWKGLSSHTEARGVLRLPLKPGEKMVFLGQEPPCKSCKGYMNRAAEVYDADVQYMWWENGKLNFWNATRGK
jgi:RHS repeat-associated protein